VHTALGTGYGDHPSMVQYRCSREATYRMSALGDEAQEWSAAFATASSHRMGIYEEVLVGPMFTPWADYLLDVLAVAPGACLLDVATGPGTVARLASGRLGPAGLVLATDLSAAMLAVAEAKGAVEDGSPIEYRLSPAVPLDAPGASFDVVCCQQGLQFFPDRPGALAEMRRALRPGGRLGLAIWAGIETCPPFAAIRDAIEEVMGTDAAERYARGPWGLHAPQTLAALVTAAGFAEVSVDEVSRPVRFEGGPSQLDRSLAASGLAAEIGALGNGRRAVLTAAVTEKLGELTDRRGAVNSHLTSQIVLAATR
jgi:SAM-dependent methyltransferase